VIRKRINIKQRTAMVYTTQQHSADSQQKKPKEEDILEASERESSKTLDRRITLAEWWAINKVNRTVDASQTAASEAAPPDAASDNGNNEPSNECAESENVIASVKTQETAPIRTPHPHDVLCGYDGGTLGMYHHAGNVKFRAWVSKRKASYLISPAHSETEKKASLIRECIALVQNQYPPGRFLKRDPTHEGWWIEAEAIQVRRKTRNAIIAANYEKPKKKPRKLNELERPEKRVRLDGNGEAGPHIDETTPARLEDDLCNVEDQARQSSTERAETEDAIASVRIQETAPIRTPHPHDVLIGRGGNRGHFYHHAGNVKFRAWVLKRKASYLIAPAHSETEKKASLIRECIALVQNQYPPGRFLKRDPTHEGWWIEAEAIQARRKTRNAIIAANYEKPRKKPRKLNELERPEKRVRLDGNGEAGPHVDETTPARLEDDLCNVDEQVRQPSNEHTETEDGIASVRTQGTTTNPTRHPHDVLFGGEGMSNHHPW
jgi:hypothetical protein